MQANQESFVSSSSTAAMKSMAPAAPEFVAPSSAPVVRPSGRLTSGTAVRVRTRYAQLFHNGWLVMWLSARVVSASGAYHYTVKYDASVSKDFAGKVVTVPAEHVREPADFDRDSASTARPPGEQPLLDQEPTDDSKTVKKTGGGIPYDALERFREKMLPQYPNAWLPWTG